jgi:hypothetical protein
LIRLEASRDEPAVSCLDHPLGTVPQALGESVRNAIRSRCAKGVSIQTAFSGTLEGAMPASFGLALSAGSLCPDGNPLNPRKPAFPAGIDRRGGLPGTLRRSDFRHRRVQAVRILRHPPPANPDRCWRPPPPAPDPEPGPRAQSDTGGRGFDSLTSHHCENRRPRPGTAEGGSGEWRLSRLSRRPAPSANAKNDDGVRGRAGAFARVLETSDLRQARVQGAED